MNDRSLCKKLALFGVAPVILACISGTLWHLSAHRETPAGKPSPAKSQGALAYTGISLDVGRPISWMRGSYE